MYYVLEPSQKCGLLELIAFILYTEGIFELPFKSTTSHIAMISSTYLSEASPELPDQRPSSPVPNRIFRTDQQSEFNVLK